MKIEPYQIEFDQEIVDVFNELNSCIVFSTYQAGTVMVLGTDRDDRLYQIPVTVKKPMGIAVKDDTMAIASLDEIQLFGRNNHVAEQKMVNKKNFDTYFINRATYNTSSIDLHDIDFGINKIWGVNTAFSCLSTFDITNNFVFKWKPNFIDELVPEDRCHLNGMAMRDGLPRYVTALSKTNTKEGWRSDIMNSGVLLEVPTSEVILDGLSMPHSPRFYENDLYLLSSGDGNLLKVDVENKTTEIYFSFGRFVRGLAFEGKYAFIGMSKIRDTAKTFNGLEVKNKSKNAGVIVFNMETREVVGEVNYINTVEEIFDVQVLKNTLKPAILTNNDERSKQVIVFANQVFWRKPKES